MLDSSRARRVDRDGALDAAVDDLAARLALAQPLEREAVALERGVGAAGEAPPGRGASHLDAAAELVDPLGEDVQLPAGPGVDVADLRHDARAEHGHAARGGATELGRRRAAAAPEPLADVHDRLRSLLGAVHHHDRPEVARLLVADQTPAGSAWRGCRRGAGRTARRPGIRSATRAPRRGARPAPPPASRSRAPGRARSRVPRARHLPAGRLPRSRPAGYRRRRASRARARSAGGWRPAAARAAGSPSRLAEVPVPRPSPRRAHAPGRRPWRGSHRSNARARPRSLSAASRMGTNFGPSGGAATEVSRISAAVKGVRRCRRS